MSVRSKTPVIDDKYCQLCSSTSSFGSNKRLSSYSCDHCHLYLCYNCFETHKMTLTDDYSQLQNRYTKITTLFQDKQQLFGSFQEHCLRNVNSAFDEVLHDLENLRKESIDYVKHQFKDAEFALSNMMTTVTPLMTKSQQSFAYDGTKKNVTFELDNQKKQIGEIEHRLNIFSVPAMKLKISTFPRNKLDLHCELLANSYQPSKKFSPSYAGKVISTKCSSGQRTEFIREKIDVETDVEELTSELFSTKTTQTGSTLGSNHNTDDDESHSVKSNTSESTNRINTELCLSTRYVSQSPIFTQNEVDRIASDGQNVLYFSDTSKLLAYVTNISSEKRTIGLPRPKEITCRWPHFPILDIVYSPISSQFICATKTGIYTCTVDSNNDDSTIDIHLQIAQHWSYVRLSTDKNYLWIWTDTPNLSQLRAYLPKTFDCIKSFNLHDYPRFADNSTSFCIHSNLIATMFQFKQPISTIPHKKLFHLTLCDSTDLRELYTVRLGECDIDHEIRANHEGLFFITNGQRKLWIVDRNGKKEFIQLNRTGRALTAHTKNQILIANGTHELQCIELK